MADLKETIVDGLKIRRAASAADEAVRKGEMDAALSGKANQADVAQLVADSTHPPVITPANQTLDLSIDLEQALTGEVKLPAETELQAAASGLTLTFQHPVANAAILDLGKTNMSNVVVQRLNASTGGVLALGLSGTDYTVDLSTGLVTVLAGNLVTSAGQSVRVTYDCAQVLDGPALAKGADGLAVKLGTTHETAARGDHGHTNDHKAACGSVGSIVTVAVDGNQRITADVNLAPASGLTKAGNGLLVDPNAVAAKNHTHADVTDSASGLMTPAQKAQLETLTGQAGLSLGSTQTVDLGRDSGGQLTADVRRGFGLDADDNGLKVNTDEVAAKDHKHNVTTGVKQVDVTSGGDGYTTAIISFTGGGGNGATAHAEIVGGEITQIILDSPGYGYTTEPDVTIDGDGNDATASALIESGSGFASPVMVDALKSHGTRLDTHDRQIATKAEKAYVDTQDAALQTQINGKAATGHTHPEADITNLVSDLAGKAPLNHTHPLATSTTDGFMSHTDKDAFGCISRILNTRSEAQQIMKGLRLESPTLGDPTACPKSLDSDTITIKGEAGVTYDIVVRVRGVTETKAVSGGVVDGRANNGGTPDSNPHNPWKLVISDPPQTIYLNGPLPGETPPVVVALDYELTIHATSGATLQLMMDSVDGLQAPNDPPLTVPGVVPYPAAFSGQFVEIEANEVTNYCSFKLLFGDASANPSVPGGSLSGGGVDDREPPGTPDPGSLPPGQPAIPSTGPGDPGTPASTNTIDIPRDLTRLDLIEGGEADGDVTEILVDGNTIWVGGDFSRWANINTWGLAKLDATGAYDPFFLIGGGFSEGVRQIRKAGTDKVLVVTSRTSLFQGSAKSYPAWMVKDDGSLVSTFTCPLVLNQPGTTPEGENKVIGSAVLSSGNVVLLAPNVLTLLDPSGAVVMQKVGTDQFNSVLAKGEKIYLSSLAFSAAGVEQKYDSQANPKGLRLVNMADDPANPRGAVDTLWALPLDAGTGANSACGQMVADPAGKYVIAGNSLTNFHSPDTSWNAEHKGNLLRYSEDFSNTGYWIPVGALTVTTDFTTSPDGNSTADKVEDSDAVDLAYLYQEIQAVDKERYVFTLFVLKDTNVDRFPLVRIEYLNGTDTNDTFAYFNTKTGAWAIGGTMGPAIANITFETVDVGTYWRIRYKTTNALAADTLRVYLYPAYSNVWGSPAVSMTGSCVFWGAQIRKDAWEDDYVATEADQVIPASTGTNSDKFRGLYKILANGKEDPNWNCNITLSGGGYVIPFAIDAKERVYIGGPISAIDGQSVLPWRLYRLTKDGAFDKEYRYFTDKVLVARITSLGQLAVGGRFTNYGAVKCGRFVLLNLDGTIAGNQGAGPGTIDTGGNTGTIPAIPILASDITPDVLDNPLLKDYIWLDLTTNPRTVRVYDNTLHQWVDCCAGHMTPGGGGTTPGGGGTPPGGGGTPPVKLPSPMFSPMNGNAPLIVSMTVYGYPGAIIFYTIDGSTPASTSTRYQAPIAVPTGMTLKAIAVLPGYTDSDISQATYLHHAVVLVPNVTFDPPTGAQTPVKVTLNCSLAGAMIHYTTDGSNPDVGSPVYSDPIDLPGETTLIKAYAEKADCVDSAITSARYEDLGAVSRIVAIQFKYPNDEAKTGKAATGHGDEDVWNFVAPGTTASGLKDIEGEAIAWDLLLQAPQTGQLYSVDRNALANDPVLKDAQILATVGEGSDPDAAAPSVYYKMDVATSVPDEINPAYPLDYFSDDNSAPAGLIDNCLFIPEGHSGGFVSALSHTGNNIGQSDFTIRLWYKPSTDNPNGYNGVTIFDKMFNNAGYTLKWHNFGEGGDGILVFYYSTNAYRFTQVNGPPIRVGQWNHIVVRGSITGSIITLRIAVNGAVGGVTDNFNFNNESCDNDARFSIGADGTSAYAPGYYDEVGIWHRCWSDSDVLADYNGGVGVGFGDVGSGRNPWFAQVLNMDAGMYDVLVYGSNVEIGRVNRGDFASYELIGAKTASNTNADTPWAEGTQFVRFRNIPIQDGDGLKIWAKGAGAEMHAIQLLQHPGIQMRLPAPTFSPAGGVLESVEVLVDESVKAPYFLLYRINGGEWHNYAGPIALVSTDLTTVEATLGKIGYRQSPITAQVFGEELPEPIPDFRVDSIGGVSQWRQTGENSFFYLAPAAHDITLFCSLVAGAPYIPNIKFEIVQVTVESAYGGVCYAAQSGSFVNGNTYPVLHVYYNSIGAAIQVAIKASKPGYEDKIIYAHFDPSLY